MHSLRRISGRDSSQAT